MSICASLKPFSRRISRAFSSARRKDLRSLRRAGERWGVSGSEDALDGLLIVKPPYAALNARAANRFRRLSGDNDGTWKSRPGSLRRRPEHRASAENPKGN